MEYCPQNAGVCITNRLFLLSYYAKSNSRLPAPYFAEPIEVFRFVQDTQPFELIELYRRFFLDISSAFV